MNQPTDRGTSAGDTSESKYNWKDTLKEGKRGVSDKEPLRDALSGNIECLF